MKINTILSLFIFFITLIRSRLVLSLAPPFSCDSSNSLTKNYHFCNLGLPISKRVDDIISRLSLDEKIAQLGDVTPPIKRLGIPGYKWWSESLHGVSNGGKGILLNGTIKSATIYPQVILTAASFNPELWYKIGEV